SAESERRARVRAARPAARFPRAQAASGRAIRRGVRRIAGRADLHPAGSRPEQSLAERARAGRDGRGGSRRDLRGGAPRGLHGASGVDAAARAADVRGLPADGPVVGGKPGAPPRRAAEQPRARGLRGLMRVLTLIVAGALALRVWGLAFGLPYAYHVDESVFNGVARQAAESRFR